tara:strand:+ start:436 stop:651 length:216 start_codon:yes stop_codon:yes gene_type:complete
MPHQGILLPLLICGQQDALMQVFHFAFFKTEYRIIDEMIPLYYFQYSAKDHYVVIGVAQQIVRLMYGLIQK